MSRPAADAAAKPAPFIWCTDCRAPMRSQYYALSTRPVCAKCRTEYAARIARGAGPGAFGRALLWGLGAALAGALLIAILIATIRVGRMLCAIGISWMVATAINKATGDFYQRRYQVMAAALTYFAVSLGSLAPIVVELTRLEDTRAAVATASGAAHGAGEGEEELDDAAADDPIEDIDAERAASRAPAKSFEVQRAESVAASGALLALPKLLMLLLGLPLLLLPASGVYGMIVGIFAFGYALYKAWDMTGDGVSYQLSGPFRVGTGPIPASF